MKFINVYNILSNIDANNIYIRLILRAMAWETYVYKRKNINDMSKWYNIARGEDLPININDYIPSEATKILLAYTILKHTYPGSIWTIHIGEYESKILDMNIWYLHGKAGKIYDSTGKIVQEDVIVSILSTGDIEGGSFVMDDTPITTPEDLYMYSIEYRQGIGRDSYPLPNDKSSIMKWLRSERILDDDNIDLVSDTVDVLLEPNSNFVDMVQKVDLWGDRTSYHDLYNTLLIRSILKAKVIKAANIIFDKYPPGIQE
jgi:hypothetical protein